MSRRFAAGLLLAVSVAGCSAENAENAAAYGCGWQYKRRVEPVNGQCTVVYLRSGFAIGDDACTATEGTVALERPSELWERPWQADDVQAFHVEPCE